MALRSDELHYNLHHLNYMLTTPEAARKLDLSYWHFMHLVEKDVYRVYVLLTDGSSLLSTLMSTDAASTANSKIWRRRPSNIQAWA